MRCSGIFRVLTFTAFVALLSGCSTNSSLQPTPATAGVSGSIHGGQQPVVGAAIQLYAVGTTGDGSAATPLLNQPVFSNANGNFTITGLYTCPTPSTLVYLTGTGGSPTSGVTNSQIALMVLVGQCSSLTSSTFLNVNEITTVAAVYALAPYMTSFSAVGSGTSDAAALAARFTEAGYIANPATGTTPGINVPNGYSVPTTQVNTIADILASCINSPGGVFADGSICGQFFFLTHPSNGPVPTDAIGALLNLANNPGINTAALYNLITPSAPFQPIQPSVPYDLSISLVANSGFTLSPAAVNFSSVLVGATQPSQTITVINTTSNPVTFPFSAPSIAGTNAFDFYWSSSTSTPCVSPIPANSTCTFQVSFVPSGAGARSAFFVLTNSSANPTLVVPLSGQGLVGSAGPVTLTPTYLAFNQPGVPQTLTLTNSGSTPLTIASIQISSGFFGETNNCGSSLAGMSSCSINVTFGGFQFPGAATLTVVDDAATGPQIAGLSSGGGGAPGSPGSVGFGGWAIGATGSQNITIYGASTFGTYDFTITGPNASDFSFAPTNPVSSTSCYYEYRQATPCDVIVYFSPSALGARNASLNIVGFGTTIALSGTGDPTGVDFGLYRQVGNTQGSYGAPLTSLNVGSSNIGTPVTASFTILNTGTVTSLSVNPPVFSGPNAAEFSIPPSCSSPCSTIVFTPTVAGAATATATYTDSTNKVTRTLALSATATTPAPVLTSTNTLLFTGIPAGTVSPSQTITVTAYNNHPIQASLAPTYTGGPQPYIFTGPTYCATTPCTLSVAYSPTTADAGYGIENAYVTATDTVGSSSGSIQLSGQVAPYAAVGINPNSLTFSSQAVNTVSAAQTVTLTNIGSTVLNLTFSVSPYGSDYPLTTTCPASLAIGANCTLSISFAPVGITGTLYTTLSVSGPAYTQYITLSGTAY